MITDIIAWLLAEIAELESQKPLTFDQWLQLRRLRRAVRALRAYAEDEPEPIDDYWPEEPR